MPFFFNAVIFSSRLRPLAFAVGPDDQHITTVDEGGVALATIQGLNQKLEAEIKEKDAQIEKLTVKAGQVDALKKRLSELEQVVQSLVPKKQSPARQ